LKLHKLKIPLLLLYAFCCVVCLYAIIIDYPNKFECKPFPTLALFFLYITQSKSKSWFFLITLVLLTLGDYLTGLPDGFNAGIVTYGISYLVFASYLIKHIKKANIGHILVYLILFGVLFSIVFIFVLHAPKEALFPILFYGLTICIVTAFVLTNYIENMYYANFIFLVAMGFRIISDCIYAIVLFSETDLYFDIFSLSMLLVSNFLFYRGFLLSENQYSDFLRNKMNSKR
jgi:hypothetical protein